MTLERPDMFYPMMSADDEGAEYTCRVPGLDSWLSIHIDSDNMHVERECIEAPVHQGKKLKLDDSIIQRARESCPFSEKRIYASDGKTFYRIKSDSEIAGIQL